jgi:hypothetical protein
LLGTTATRGRGGPLGAPPTIDGGAGTSSPKSANNSSLLTSDEVVFGAIGRTLFAAAQGNALARGFCEAAQPETIAATAHSIAQINFAETRCEYAPTKSSFVERSLGAKRESSRETRVSLCDWNVALFGSSVASLNANVASCRRRELLDRGVATRTGSKM